MPPAVAHGAEPIDRLAERYGARRDARSGVAAAGLVVGIVLLVVVGWLIYRNVDEPVEAGLASWDEPAHGVLLATVEIVRDPNIGVTCELVAVDVRQFVVGELTLEVPPGPEERLRVPAAIPLEGDAIAPELRGCSPAD